MSFVVDASIALSWCFADEATPRTEELRDRLKSDGATVSHVWPLEVSNVILQSERRGRMAQADTLRMLELLGSYPISVDREGIGDAFNVVVSLARTQGLTTYDASYLELAMRVGLPLATDDRDLRTAADVVGVHLL